MAWMERQGQLGDLTHQSKEQLQELLLRQEKILSNKRLVQTLPDKGGKIREFAERIRFAIEHHDEEERKRSLVSAARAELQSKYQQAFATQRGAARGPAPAAATQSDASTGGAGQEKGTSPVSMLVLENHSLDKHKSAAVGAMETAAAAAAAAEASENLGGTKEKDLAEALERVTLTDTAGTGSTQETKEPLRTKATENYFLRQQMPKKPHYVTVLERTEAAPTKQKFKLNQLPNKNDTSPSGSASPGRSTEGPSPLSAQARRERDRKHLDDITAAKLPPLHHNPAQLLSLQESADLVKEQTKRQQELHAKLAAQKLSEGLRVSMGSYPPDGSPMAAYREVHDEGAQLSSEED